MKMKRQEKSVQNNLTESKKWLFKDNKTKFKCVMSMDWFITFTDSLKIKINFHRETELLKELSCHLNILHFWILAFTRNNSRHDLTVIAIFRSPTLDVVQMAFHECLNARWKACYGGCQRSPDSKDVWKAGYVPSINETCSYSKILNEKKWHARSDVWFI